MIHCNIASTFNRIGSTIDQKVYLMCICVVYFPMLLFVLSFECSANSISIAVELNCFAMREILYYIYRYAVFLLDTIFNILLILDIFWWDVKERMYSDFTYYQFVFKISTSLVTDNWYRFNANQPWDSILCEMKQYFGYRRRIKMFPRQYCLFTRR